MGILWFVKTLLLLTNPEAGKGFSFDMSTLRLPVYSPLVSFLAYFYLLLAHTDSLIKYSNALNMTY